MSNTSKVLTWTNKHRQTDGQDRTWQTWAGGLTKCSCNPVHPKISDPAHHKLSLPKVRFTCSLSAYRCMLLTHNAGRQVSYFFPLFHISPTFPTFDWNSYFFLLSGFLQFKVDAGHQVPNFFYFSWHTPVFSYFVKLFPPIFLFFSLFTLNLYFMYFFLGVSFQIFLFPLVPH